MQKIAHTMRDKIGLPSTFTLDAVAALPSKHWVNKTSRT